MYSVLKMLNEALFCLVELNETIRTDAATTSPELGRIVEDQFSLSEICNNAVEKETFEESRVHLAAERDQLGNVSSDPERN